MDEQAALIVFGQVSCRYSRQEASAGAEVSHTCTVLTARLRAALMSGTSSTTAKTTLTRANKGPKTLWSRFGTWNAAMSTRSYPFAARGPAIITQQGI